MLVFLDAGIRVQSIVNVLVIMAVALILARMELVNAGITAAESDEYHMVLVAVPAARFFGKMFLSLHLQ